MALKVTVKADIRDFKASMTEAKKSMQSAVDGVKQSWAPVSRTLKRVGILFAGLGGTSIKMASDFEAGVAEVTTLLGETTPEAVKAMREELQNLAAASGQSLKVLTKAKYDIISAGFTKAADSAKVLAVSTKAAIAGITDVSVTADLLTSALNSYNLNADEANRISDILFTTVKQGKTTMSELGGSLGRIFPIAKAANLSLESLGAAMATLTAGGLSTDESATALRGALMALTAPTKEAKDAMEEAGIEVYRFSDGTLDLAKTIAQFQGLDPAAIRKFIPDVRAGIAITSMANNIEKLRTNIQGMGEAAGATEAAYSTMAKTFKVQFNQVLRELQNILIDLGNELLPVFKKAIIDVKEHLPDIREKLKSVAEAIGDMAGWFIGHIDIVAKIAGFALALKSLSIIISTGKIITSLYEMAMAIKAVSLAFAFTPTGLAVIGLAAIIGGVALAIKNLQTSAAGSDFSDFDKEIINMGKAAGGTAQAMAVLTKVKAEYDSLMAKRAKGELIDINELNLIKESMNNLVQEAMDAQANLEDLGTINLGITTTGVQTTSQAVKTLADDIVRISNISESLNLRRPVDDMQIAFVQTGEVAINVANSIDSQWQVAIHSISSLTNRMTSIISSAFIEQADSGKSAAKQIEKAFKAMILSITAEIASKAAIFAILSAIPGAQPFIASTGGFMKFVFGGFQGGGIVPENPSYIPHFGTRDTIPVLAQPGEAFISKPVVDMYGRENIEKFAKTGDPSGLGSGDNIHIHINALDGKSVAQFFQRGDVQRQIINSIVDAKTVRKL